MIEAKQLCKDYGPVCALRDASFSIGRNEVVGVLGPNGAGKTTLMKILTGYLHPTAGLAHVDGIDVVDAPLAVQAKIGYLPENAPIYPDLMVQEYLQLIAELREIPLEQRTALISEAVRRTGLEDYLVRPIGELSKGYRQRVGLAQAILHQPSVLVLDEPSSGLDPRQIVGIRTLIKDLARSATVLLSTHILSEVEVTCERVLIINEGKVCADAKIADLRTRSAAVTSVDGQAAEVQRALGQIAGVSSVIQTGRTDGFTTFRIAGGDADLCPTIYDVVKQRGWRLSELRADEQNLETVFRQVVEGQLVEQPAQAANGGQA